MSTVILSVLGVLTICFLIIYTVAKSKADKEPNNTNANNAMKVGLYGLIIFVVLFVGYGIYWVFSK